MDMYGRPTYKATGSQYTLAPVFALARRLEHCDPLCGFFACFMSQGRGKDICNVPLWTSPALMLTNANVAFFTAGALLAMQADILPSAILA
jgi:hypothetical protein